MFAADQTNSFGPVSRGDEIPESVNGDSSTEWVAHANKGGDPAVQWFPDKCLD